MFVMDANSQLFGLWFWVLVFPCIELHSNVDNWLLKQTVCLSLKWFLPADVSIKRTRRLCLGQWRKLPGSISENNLQMIRSSRQVCWIKSSWLNNRTGRGGQPSILGMRCPCIKSELQTNYIRKDGFPSFLQSREKKEKVCLFDLARVGKWQTLKF